MIRTIPVKLRGSNLSRYLYIRRVNSPAFGEMYKGHIVLVTNLPPFTEEDEIRSWFEMYGSIYKLKYGVFELIRPKPHSQTKTPGKKIYIDSEFDIEKIFDKVPNGVWSLSATSNIRNLRDVVSRRAYCLVIFESKESVDKLFKYTKVDYGLSEKRAENVRGEKHFLELLYLKNPSHKFIEESINEYMDKYEYLEKVEKKEIEKLATMPDEDGFVLATGDQVAKFGPGDENFEKYVERKEKKLYKKDFYKFQLLSEKRKEKAISRKLEMDEKERIDELRKRI